MAIIRRWGGVLIADSVGLGKTHMGAALVQTTAARDKVIVVTPAALRRQWARLLPQGAVWYSHTRLSLGQARAQALGPSDMVVVDEAHAFRNPKTHRYVELARLCTHARVVLLTATPINNSPRDVYHLIRLFASDFAFTEIGIPNLRHAFSTQGSPEHDMFRVQQQRAVLAEIMVRRTRVSLERRGMTLPHGLSFPRRSLARPVRFDLDAAYLGGIDSLLRTIESIRFTAFDSGPTAPGQGAALLRFTLLKRLESSTTAFKATVRGLIRYHEALLNALASGRTVSARDYRRLFGEDGGQLVLAALVLPRAPSSNGTAAAVEAVAADLARLRSLLGAIPIAAAADPKVRGLEALVARLDTKVLVFTEYRETAIAIWKMIRNRFPTGLIHGGGAYLGMGRASRRVVVERFAPNANGAPEPAWHECVQVLIATDVLAEGLNLQDAAHVVSYDLPWNPVRLIQRAGRIDRLGSKHDVVHIHCVMPDAGLDRMLGLADRLRAKLASIRAGIQSDGRPARSTKSIVDRITRGDASFLDELEALEADAPIGGDPLLVPRAATRRVRRTPTEELVRRILAMIAGHANRLAGPSDPLLRRADLVCAQLGAGLRVGAEIRLTRALRVTTVESTSLDEILTAAEAALAGTAHGSCPDPPAGPIA